ncbi:MAG TPA: sulfotransferase family 2 domain-containing protein [Anaerolineae bacterium]|nr:sulfotransferase family 2 domain-containing protein [Anaerolineae bacterium]HMR62509.1 sulfotransferase family 2 domain-containing protein [Anaerolineae bacterium]
MIISHKYRYVFISVPHTACTTIRRELCEFYEGQEILHKHAHYNEFLKIANPEERKYFAFAGIRNPLDEAVSYYFKLKSNHRGNYTKPEKLVENGGFVTQTQLERYRFVTDHQADFATYFKHFYRTPYKNTYTWAHEELDYLVRYENLQEDFGKALELCGIQPVRWLPLFNKTADKNPDYLTYYPADTYEQAGQVFGPFMKKWGYHFPPEWRIKSPSGLAQFKYRVSEAISIFCLRNLRWDPDRCNRAFNFSSRMLNKITLGTV